LTPVLLRSPAPLALMGLIFFLSAQSDPGADIGAFGRVLAHAGEYALLTALWAWALAPLMGGRSILAGAAISFLYALSDELHQSFVAGRDADPFDIAIDAAGIAIASWALSRASRPGSASPTETSPRSDRRPS
jgi:VanZ family protein